MISVIIVHPQCRNPTNLLICNTCFVVSTYFINTLIVSIYGFRKDWAEQQPLCSLRAYCFLMSGSIVCYAYLIQSISRLFFTVFFNHKYLQTYRIHCYLIVANWIFGAVSALQPLFIDGGYRYERESRLCTLTTQTVLTSMYGMIVGFMIPLSGAYIIYFVIFIEVHRSARRVIAAAETVAVQIQTFNIKREVKLIRNMFIVMSIFTSAGTPYLLVGFWVAIKPSNPPPEAMYLPIVNIITFCVTLMMIVLFNMNKQVKKIVFNSCR